MNYALTKRAPCCVCGVNSFRHIGWLLVVENRWLDRLKILSWHASLATQRDIKSVCCIQHLKILIAYWLNQASLRLPPGHNPPLPIGSDPDLTDFDLGPQSVGRLLGELAVHREAFSRVWSGSPEALECILDALLAIKTEGKPRALGLPFCAQPEPSRGLTLQSSAGGV